MRPASKNAKTGKAELAAELLMLGRDLGTAGIVFHQTVAERLGLNTTDHKCLDLLSRHPDPTAGDLAQWTGLTTGAITGVIDRLERAGFVRRVEHPSDRRKVVLSVVVERLPEVGELFAGLAKGMTEVCANYTAAELCAISDYLRRSAEVFRRETGRLQQPRK